MSTIRDVVRDLAEREGVDAVVVLGPDGIPIDSSTSGSVEAEDFAAMVPRAVSAIGDLGAAAGRVAFSTGVAEYDDGLLILTRLTPRALMAISVRHGVNIGPLLHELRRDHSAMAALF